jgi:hypothetical protein
MSNTYTLENCGDNGGIVPVKALYWALLKNVVRSAPEAKVIGNLQCREPSCTK